MINTNNGDFSNELTAECQHLTISDPKFQIMKVLRDVKFYYSPYGIKTFY